MNVKVRFTSVPEFVEELRQNSHPDRQFIVRLTKLYMPSSFTPVLQHVEVVAACVLQLGGVPQLIEFRAYCGDYLAHDQAASARSLEKADGLVRQLKESIAELGLEMRAGYFMVEDAKVKA